MMDKNRKRTPAVDARKPAGKGTDIISDAAETIAKEVAVAAISKKVPAMKPIARPLVDMAFRKGKPPRKKGRKI